MGRALQGRVRPGPTPVVEELGGVVEGKVKVCGPVVMRARAWEEFERGLALERSESWPGRLKDVIDHSGLSTLVPPYAPVRFRASLRWMEGEGRARGHGEVLGCARRVPGLGVGNR